MSILRSVRATEIILAFTGLVASTVMVAAAITPLVWLNAYGQAIGLIFIVVLIVWLWRTVPQMVGAPTAGLSGLSRFAFGPTLSAVLVILLLMFLISFAAHPQLVLIAASTLASAGLMAARVRAVTGRSVVIGLGLSTLCFVLSHLSGRLDPYMAFYLACIPVLFVGGTLLATDTGVARVYSAEGHWQSAAFGFLGGCLLALPSALLNVSFGAHSGDLWVDQTWEPLAALIPGIAEETWARLFLLTLIFAILQPASRPRQALLAAVVIAAVVHALAHLPAALVFSPAALPMGVAALLFGVPMGLIYVRFGFEWAVGYHFFIDFVRFGVALLAQ